MTRNPEIMELIKKYQDYINFLKTPPEENYDEKEVDKIINKGEQIYELLIQRVNNKEPLDVGSDKLTTEEVYDRVMSKDSWIFIPGPKNDEVTNE